jgi:hypothetical protein
MMSAPLLRFFQAPRVINPQDGFPRSRAESHLRRRILFLIGMTVFLAGCLGTTGSGQPATGGELTITPTTISIVLPEYKTVPFPFCEIASYPVIRTSTVQGDQIAWAPKTDRIAFIASNSGSQWNLGDLSFVSIPANLTPIRLAQYAVGNLSWSPGGIYLAFVSLRTADGVYTLEAATPDGKETVDFFPGEAAKTDAWASPKIVQQWQDDQHLQGLTSCGLVCAQPVDIDINNRIQKASGDPIRTIIDFWKVHHNLPDPAPAILKDALEINWSPDSSRAVYFDKRGNVWVVTPETGSQFQIPLPTWDTPYEGGWSADGRFLALRAGFTLHLYDSICQ